MERMGCPRFILELTRDIWEGRNVASLRERYAEEIVVRSPASVVVGNRAVIAATMATLSEFPDRVLLGEDVIWCETGGGGMFSSHRIVSTATHGREGAYGEASGTPLRWRIIADCHVRDNKVDDEWLIRDQGAIARQLGFSPRDYAEDLIAKEGGAEKCVAPYTPANEVAGPYEGSGDAGEWGERHADILTRIMAADFAVVAAAYDRAAGLEYAGGVSALSYDGAERFWMGLRAAFPSAEFRICHVVGREDARMPPRSAARWTLHGKHDGWGMFGQPTGAEVFVMGASHAEFSVLTGEAKLRREWTLFDEVAIWKQILLQTGEAAV